MYMRENPSRGRKRKGKEKTASGPNRNRFGPFCICVSGLAQAAGGDNLAAGEPARIVGSEEDGDGTDVVGLTGAAERSLGDERLLEVGADETRGLGPFRLDDAGIDGIHANFLG